MDLLFVLVVKSTLCAGYLDIDIFASNPAGSQVAKTLPCHDPFLGLVAVLHGDPSRW